jgi:hypothetical protein
MDQKPGKCQTLDFAAGESVWCIILSDQQRWRPVAEADGMKHFDGLAFFNPFGMGWVDCCIEQRAIWHVRLL